MTINVAEPFRHLRAGETSECQHKEVLSIIGVFKRQKEEPGMVAQRQKDCLKSEPSLG